MNAGASSINATIPQPEASVDGGRELPSKRNRLVVIGYMGVKTAYLNMSDEEALKRHLQAEWGEDATAEDEARARDLMTAFEFDDHFHTYDASGCSQGV